MVRMNGSPGMTALEVALVLMMADGKVQLRTPCLIDLSDSVCGKGWWRHLVPSLSRLFLGRLNVTCLLDPSWSVVLM